VPLVAAAELPPPDLQDVAPEVLHQRGDLRGCHLGDPLVGLGKRVLDDREADLGVVQFTAATRLAHGDVLLGGAGDLVGKLIHPRLRWPNSDSLAPRELLPLRPAPSTPGPRPPPSPDQTSAPSSGCAPSRPRTRPAIGCAGRNLSS